MFMSSCGRTKQIRLDISLFALYDQYWKQRTRLNGVDGGGQAVRVPKIQLETKWKIVVERSFAYLIYAKTTPSNLVLAVREGFG